MKMHPLVGRKEECRVIEELMHQRKNILVTGEGGVGKSAILDHVMAARSGKNVLYSKQSATLKGTLVNIVEFATGAKNLAKKNILALKKICYQLLDPSPEYLILDHLGWVEPKFYGFLIYLTERRIPLIIVTREREKQRLGHFWMGLYDFEKLEIKNLDAAGTDQLIDSCAASLDLKLEDTADFKREVFRTSKGNPKIIEELCRLAGDEKYEPKKIS
ncbi:MAG TPA: hypothetical protein VLX11_07155 [Candidatus Acidoferrales bacterium]|nr:hypothetical protein [Candidatus Acidoferrales bacterium]